MSSATAAAPPHPEAEAAGACRLRVVAVLGRYGPLHGAAHRAVVALERSDGSILVLDREASSRKDARVVAVHAPDEPFENSVIVSEMYLSDPSRGRCRPLTDSDLDCTQAPVPPSDDGQCAPPLQELLDGEGRIYAIRACPSDDSVDHLRWTRADVRSPDGPLERLTVRDVVGALESYEPARTMTVWALALAGMPGGVSSHRLRGELARLDSSRLVLNRGLREAVARHVAEGATLSQIALRCGRTKHDHRGAVSGETSWLSRRIGVMAEAGGSRPTPWLHSDTLALIARRGLGVAPVEVEL